MTDETQNPNEFLGPTCRYGPNGQSKIFHKIADVPEGWVDDPQKLTNPDSKSATVDEDPELPLVQAAMLPLTRKQIMAELNEKQIKYSPTQTTAALYDLLVDETEKEA